MLVSINSFAKNGEEIADCRTCVSITENNVGITIVAYYPNCDKNYENLIVEYLLVMERTVKMA